MKRHKHPTLAAATLIVAAPSFSGTAKAGPNIIAESVNIYEGGDQLAGRVYNGQAFLDGMTNYGADPTWHARPHYTNGSVWKSDFFDPQLPVPCTGFDATYFDAPNTSISFFSGHGKCGYGSNQPCSVDSDCVSPQAQYSQSLPGYCVRDPSSGKRCHYTTSRALYTYSDYNCSPPAPGYGAVYYGTYARFGESTNAGSWGGVGTNGGTNVVVLDISCGACAPAAKLYYEVLPIFAGAHMLNTIMPVNGDTSDSGYRGGSFADAYRTNAWSSVGQGWREAMLDDFAGDGCAQGAFPGTGISGCGAFVTVTLAENSGWASWRVAGEHWYQAQSDYYDVGSVTWWTYAWLFNYDIAAYPLQ